MEIPLRPSSSPPTIAHLPWFVSCKGRRTSRLMNSPGQQPSSHVQLRLPQDSWQLPRRAWSRWCSTRYKKVRTLPLLPLFVSGGGGTGRNGGERGSSPTTRRPGLQTLRLRCKSVRYSRQADSSGCSPASCLLSPSPTVLQCRFKNFDDVDIWDVNLPFSIFARVDVQFPVRASGIQRFILLDMTGCKIEAVARGPVVSIFDELVKEGCTYTIHRVMFKKISDDGEFRNISNTYECCFGENTYHVPFTLPIQFPPHPKHLMSFPQVFKRPDKTFVDIAGIVVHWGELEHIGNYPNMKHYREILIMDERYNMLAVGIGSEHLRKHAISLPAAAANKQIIIGTMLKNNYKYGCYETSSYTKFCIQALSSRDT